MSTFQYVKNNLAEPIQCTRGFKVAVYGSFAAVWLNFAFGG